MARKDQKIGQLLMEAGLIAEDQLERALETQKSSGGRICSHLVKMGYLSADTLLDFLSYQFGVAAVNLSHYRISEGVLALVPAELAVKHRVIPVNRLENTLILAMEDPRDGEAVKEIEAVTGLAVDPLICPQAVIEEALETCYGIKRSTLAPPQEKNILSLDEIPDLSNIYNPHLTPEALSPENWLRRIIFLGIKRRSREIHLEPHEEDAVVRYRLGLRLVHGESLPREAGRAVVELLERYGQPANPPQGGEQREGWLKVRVKNHELRVVFSAYPVIYGQRVVLKLFDEAYIGRKLADQGLEAEEEQRIIEPLKAGRRGIYLIASPPDHQREWTLYRLVSLLRNDALNIMMVEPFLLYPVTGVNQARYVPGSVRSLLETVIGALRQTPDLLAISEMADFRVLARALMAASRCTVLGTLPMGNVGEVLTWLQDSQYNRAALSQLLIGVLAQRVVPRLCPHCRKPLETNLDMIEGTRDLASHEISFFYSPGCQRCDGTGQMGQVGLFESLIFDPALQELYATGVPSKVIYEEAQRRGMRTIYEDGVLKASAGVVDMREVLKVSAYQEAGSQK